MFGRKLVPMTGGVGRSYRAYGKNLTAIKKQIDSFMFYNKAWKIRRARIIGSAALSSEKALRVGRAMDVAVSAMKDEEVNRTLEDLNLTFVSAQQAFTNATEGGPDASVAIADLITMERSTRRPVVVEFKFTSLTMPQLVRERECAPRKSKTAFRPCLLDKAKIQAQLGALFMANTFSLPTRPAALVIFKCFGGSVYHEWVEECKEEDFWWIKGYRK